MPFLILSAQQQSQSPGDQNIVARFVKQEPYLKAGDLGFNIIRINNNSDSSVRIKPILLLPTGWKLLNAPFRDTLVPARDSISLSFRYQLPRQVSSETTHQIEFKAYSIRNRLLAECSLQIASEIYHDWEVIYPEKRIFFYPGMNMAKFDLEIINRGNATETITLEMQADLKLELNGKVDRLQTHEVVLEPYSDSLVSFFVRYKGTDDRVFDMCKLQITASNGINKVTRSLLLEKYSDLYSPLFIDGTLPHQAEAGIRTFSGNREFLPFIKARGLSRFKNNTTFFYNFNYYAVTGNEDFISNSYYTFLYSWQSFNVGIGSFSSSLGRNLYTRHGVMLNNTIRLAPWLSMEAFLCQSFFTPKTSVAIGSLFELKKTSIHGSFAYDVDDDKKVNTTSAIFQSSLIRLVKNHDVSFNLFGYHENHYRNNNYTLMGIGWDINYYGRFGDRVALQLTNNYGSPDIPGPQMGLINFSANTALLLGNRKQYISIKYINGSRKYSNYSSEGNKLPMNKLYDQYGTLIFHSSDNANHIFDIGPGIESYRSTTPKSASGEDGNVYYQALKFRLEYKAVIYKNLSVNLKTGVSDITVKETIERHDLRYDFHLLGAYSVKAGYGVSFSYDYGPMVNSGLYQFASDVRNHSLNLGPSMMTSYFHGRVNLNIFANLTYRIDLKYASININPKIETYVARNWYVVVGGTYHYTQQKYSEFLAQSNYAYVEFSIRKKWGKSDFNQWYKDTRSLKIVLFKDDNSNGLKDEGEEGVPFVKTRVKLTNAASPNFKEQFPIDITLLSNDAGIVIYNRLPVGFYDIQVTPLIDVKEYFYVNRSAEKVELSKTTTYYIPFQKATRITGKIDLQRDRFSVDANMEKDLTNIKITAYNTQGNSYSSFTLSDGTFTIFVPGDVNYYVRMENVFGSRFKIMKNDIQVHAKDGVPNEVVFDIRESVRQVAFKQAKPAPPTDTLVQEPLKIKVLHGKFYENRSDSAVDINAMPDFDVQASTAEVQNMIIGNSYVYLARTSDQNEALLMKKVFDENGLNTSIGYYESKQTYYVFTNYYQTQESARKELDLLKKGGIKDAAMLKVE